MAARAVDLDPLAAVFSFSLCQAHYARREYPECLKQARTILELEPSQWFG